MRTENRIDYVEIPVTDLGKTREFFTALFGWTFQEWGDDYLSFSDGRLHGGFRRADTPVPSPGVLIVFYSEDLQRDLEKVSNLGATISQEIFDLPGGRRFHVVDPVGTEYAIWSANLNKNGA